MYSKKKNMYHSKANEKKAGAGILVSEKNITRDKEGYFKMKMVQLTRKIEQFQICMWIP